MNKRTKINVNKKIANENIENAVTLAALHTHTHTHTLCQLKAKEQNIFFKVIVNLMYKLVMVGFLCPPLCMS